MRGPRYFSTYLAIFALLLTLPLLVGVAVTTYNFANAERSRLEALADSADQDILAIVDRELSTRITLLRTLSSSTSLQTGDIARFEGRVRELSQINPLQLILYDRSGQQLVNTRLPPGSPLPSAGDANLIREVTETKRPYVSNLFVGAVSKSSLVQVATPVMRDGEVIGILGSSFTTDHINTLLRDNLPRGPFTAAILDRTGIFIGGTMNPDEMIGQPMPALSRAAQDGDGGKGGISMLDAQGIPIFAFWRRSDLSGWVVAAAVERAALTAPLTRQLLLLAEWAAVFAVVAIGGAVWISRRLAAAHRSLVVAAKAVGEGRLVEPPTTYLVEVNSAGKALAEASRSLAAQSNELQRTNQELEHRVITRTEQLMIKTALLETTLDTMDQGLIAIDGHGRIPLINRRAREILNIPDDLLSSDLTHDQLLLHQETSGDFDETLDARQRPLRPQIGDAPSVYERLRPNGMALEVRTVPIKGDNGFVRTLTDVTQRRAHARELEAAKEAAELANRSKGDFLATMSHEMRTPLNAVIGYSELLLSDRSLAGPARLKAERIEAAGLSLLALVNDILDFGKIDAGVFSISCEYFELETLVHDAISIIRPFAMEKGLSLHIYRSNSVPNSFLGDKERIGQVLVNLLNNAIKFTSSGSVSLSTSAELGQEGVYLVRFTVTDTGIGVARSDQARLFQRFYQVDPTLHRAYGGAGLGLAISKHLVDQMEGRFDLDSELGRGSTFSFEIPLASTPAENRTKLTATASRTQARILVAEDITINQELARELLESAGFTVDVVANGHEAVQAVRTGAYHAVLMDLSMPGMDGLTATRAIRDAGGDESGIPIIACTANVLPSHVSAFEDAGVDGYLKKPLRRAELYHTIDRVLAEAGIAVAVTAREGASEASESIDSVIGLLGTKLVLSAINGLTVELRGLLVDELDTATDRIGLADRAHAVISTACLLDLKDLAERCSDLEVACREAMGIGEAVARVKPAISSALTTLRYIREAADAYASDDRDEIDHVAPGLDPAADPVISNQRDRFVRPPVQGSA